MDRAARRMRRVCTGALRANREGTSGQAPPGDGLDRRGVLAVPQYRVRGVGAPDEEQVIVPPGRQGLIIPPFATLLEPFLPLNPHLKPLKGA